jgi:hypothetical protein
MMNNNVLFLECRGCPFMKGDKIAKLSDVGNYRVGVYSHRIKAKDGNEYILEFGSYDRKETIYTNSRTGKPLKHPKCEVVLENALHISTEYETLDSKKIGLAFGNCKLEKQIHDKKEYLFTKSDILKVVNSISKKQYSKIVLVSNENIINAIPEIYKFGGYREKSILDSLVEVKTEQYTKEYHVYTFIAENGDTFDYEALSKRIVG